MASLDYFVEKWESQEEVGRAVRDMGEKGDDEDIFKESYSEVREHVPDELRPEFPDYIPDAEDARMVKGMVLENSKKLQKGLRNSAIDYSERNISGFLDEIEARIGDNFYQFLALSMEPQVDQPSSLVNAIEEFRDVMSPLRGEDSPNVPVMRNKLREDLDRRTSDSDEDVKTIAQALSEIYDDERLVSVNYQIQFAKPVRESFKQKVEQSDEWKNYLIENMQELGKEERLDFYTGLYSMVREG